jgi:uncharacterized protein YodC (DUF2158 family)
MSVIKSGDLVVLKSGGPTMTVDTVNTDIFDDNKITGVLCVWFVGDKLERVRFDHRAIEPAAAQKTSSKKKGVRHEEATGEYKTVMDEMVAAMNVPVDAKQGGPVRRRKPAAPSKPAAATKPAAANKPAAASKREASAAVPATDTVRVG